MEGESAECGVRGPKCEVRSAKCGVREASWLESCLPELAWVGRTFARFVNIAYGSHLETQTNLQVALSRSFLSRTEFDRLWEISEEAKATTLGLLTTLKRRIAARKRSNRIRR